jgi:cyclic beta-1,2-glucan synthetase
VLSRQPAAPGALAHGISGDLPIVLVRIDDAEDSAIVRQLLRAHEYWRMKRLAVDLVILNERAPSYVRICRVAGDGSCGAASRPAARAGARRERVHRARRSRDGAERDVLADAARAVLSSRQRHARRAGATRASRAGAAAPRRRGAPRAHPRRAARRPRALQRPRRLRDEGAST